MSLLGSSLLVGAGGAVGSALRFLLTGAVHRLLPAVAFPLGTLAVNVVGCFAIGLLAGPPGERPPLNQEARLLLVVGLLGGFTTFSSFAHETLALGRETSLERALANVALQVVLGLAAAWAGALASRWLAG